MKPSEDFYVTVNGTRLPGLPPTSSWVAVARDCKAAAHGAAHSLRMAAHDVGEVILEKGDKPLDYEWHVWCDGNLHVYSWEKS